MNPYGPNLEEFDGPKIAAVGIVSGDEVLTGRRRDNGLWTCPGGHLDPGESKEDAAVREVFEESGIRIDKSDLKLIGQEKIVSPRTGRPFVVFAFCAKVNKKDATAKFDPDNEIVEWKWVKLRKDTPELKRDMRHAKRDLVVEYLLHC